MSDQSDPPPRQTQPHEPQPSAAQPASPAPANPLAAAETHITDAGGRPVTRVLSAREVWLAAHADAALRAAQAVPAGSGLVRVEVNGLVPDSDPTYLYLRYQPTLGAPLEFWAGFRHAASLNLKRGLVGVPAAGAPA
ncbi:hypothetical protein [Deinococcus sp.]|uniref:hypothetical protein n=1 Tax=Deinococcus sp. TaxID=47478 RepID=UPI003CC5C2F3